MISIILIVTIIGVVTLFSIQNITTVSVSLLHWKFETTLPALVCLAVLLGVVVAQLVRRWSSGWSSDGTKT